jgi:hypothetical protein
MSSLELGTIPEAKNVTLYHGPRVLNNNNNSNKTKLQHQQQ